MRLQRQTSCAVVALILSETAGCSANLVEVIPGVCTQELRPGVVVEIRDAQTNTPLARAATGVVREGAYVDSLRPAGSLTADPESLYSRAAAGERAGTYEIEVQRAGYVTFRRSGVRVERDECHVQTVHVVAALVPTP
jgi:hypothetical protein